VSALPIGDRIFTIPKFSREDLAVILVAGLASAIRSKAGQMLVAASRESLGPLGGDTPASIAT